MKDFVLNNNQKKIIKKIDFFGNKFYLAGGTALALQLGHRTSADFDFYSEKGFNSEKLLLKFQKVFKKDISNAVIAEDTLKFRIKSTHLSFFKYEYPLIKPTTKLHSINLASPEDIAAMKIIAIVQRGTKRDFVDMYYLIKLLGINTVFTLTKEKYREMFNKYLGLRSLIYFADAEKKQARTRIYLYDPRIDWKTIKSYLKEQVIFYQKSIIKELRK